MFNLGALAANVLNSLDSAAKETLEEPRISATALRSQRHSSSSGNNKAYRSDEDDDDIEGDATHTQDYVETSGKPPVKYYNCYIVSQSSALFC